MEDKNLEREKMESMLEMTNILIGENILMWKDSLGEKYLEDKNILKVKINYRGKYTERKNFYAGKRLKNA